MARVSTKCVHPFKKVTVIAGWRLECTYFTWCKACKKIIEWGHAWDNRGFKARKIPFDWPEDIRNLASRLSGYPIQRDPSTMIAIPCKEPNTTATLSDLLARLYSEEDVVKLQDMLNHDIYKKAFGGK